MSISIMGSVNSYTKTMKLQTQWNLKQKTGDYSSHKKSLEEWVSTAQEALKKSQNSYGYSSNDDDEESNKKLNAIMEKIYAGKKLTDKERRFLQAKNPQAYEKLRSIEREQKAYEQKLRQCKTKEEVQRLKMNQIASSLSVIGSVRNNPNISEGKKLEICMQEKMRCDRMEESTQKFVRSGEYNRLPTEAEQAKAQKEEKERLEAALKPQEEQTEKTEKIEKTEKTESAEPTSPETEPAEAATGQPETKTAAEKPAATSSAPSTSSPKKVVAASTVKPAQATAATDTSPELRKVRRARRQAASAAYTAAQTASQASTQPALNINA